MDSGAVQRGRRTDKPGGRGVPPGPLGVARGGSFNDVVFGARASYRRAYPPGFFYPFLGFRIIVGVV